jgi:hypothetical protein
MHMTTSMAATMAIIITVTIITDIRTGSPARP